MNFLDKYFCFQEDITINGFSDELTSLYISELYNNTNKSILVLTSNLYECNRLYEKLSLYNEHTMIFPMDDFLTSVAIAISPDLKNKRLEVLNTILEKEKVIVVTSLTGYLRFLPNLKEYNCSMTIEKGNVINKSILLNNLLNYGYQKEELVTNTGEIASRGFVVDMFLIGECHPIRVELFGDVVENIKYFDENTQLSIKNIDSVIIKPYIEVKTTTPSYLVDYLENPIQVFINYSQIEAANSKLEQEILEYAAKKNEDANAYMAKLTDLKTEKIIYLNNIDNSKYTNKCYTYNSQSIVNFSSDFSLLKNYVIKQIEQHKTVIFCLSQSKQIEKIKNVFENNICLENVITNKINVLMRKINNGFIIDDYVVIGEYDIQKIANKSIRYSNNLRIGRKIKGFNDLKKGDYVVHSINGIGIYNGVITLKKGDLLKDYIQVNYKDDDKVYIPVEKIETLYKYSSKEGIVPKINRLGSSAWIRTKMQIRKKVDDISEELLRLNKTRASIEGPMFKNLPEAEIFKNEFEYEETADQTKAINEVLKDLSLKKPMDRLLCGDVGFGKTEVAFRAMFKTVLNGFQVAYLCPTTILSKQQYENAIKRFSNYAINIKLLNRFTGPSESKKIIADLKNRKIDVLIGTHRLLSNDILFNNLGLLIVDEEQRFGVKHKEKIKQIKENVNVLTMSATPIPRTLKFAMTGLRDLSVIDTAPTNRYPIQTYVIEENDLLIKEAIEKELARKGQVFILYNRINDLESKKIEIEKMIPNISIRIAHGQLNKNELELIMQDFVDQKFDVLLCTTIIETGIDIPNVNTLIIYNADLFGLAQLYQVRGRVGRSDRIAYAYLTYNKNKLLNDIAIKRLQAIKEFTELGSGYKVAMRDLSIRGAGDLLGKEQAGFIDSIGIDYYLKLIEDATNNIEDDETEQNSIIDVDTHVRDEYVSDESIKIEIHKLISEIDSFEKLNNVKTEIEDRFGAISEQLLIYMYSEWLEKLAQKFNISKIDKNENYVSFYFDKETTEEIKGDKLLMIGNNISRNFKFEYKNKRIYVKLFLHGLTKHYVYFLVELLKDI